MLSIICCSNKLDLAQSMLEASLKTQTEPYEFILIDNSSNHYHSAAHALNTGALQANGDILVFVHQDVSFDDPSFLRNIRQSFETLPNGSLVGLAGVKDSSGVYTNILQGPNRQPAGDHPIKAIQQVQTLDEVLIAVERSTFLKQLFDEKTCDDWHLYGVDLCLSAQANGSSAYVLPLDLYHLSSGKISWGYARTLFKVIRKHRHSFPYIYTTCSSTKTTTLRSIQYVWGLVWDHVIRKG